MSRPRRALWIAGTPVRAFLLGAISLYRSTLSGWLGGQCRFYPSCSQYAMDAIRVHGAIRGTAMATWRVLRCNPFGSGGVEYIAVDGHDFRPGRSARYDDDIHTTGRTEPGARV